MDLSQIEFLLRETPERAEPLIKEALEMQEAPFWSRISPAEFNSAYEKSRHLLRNTPEIRTLLDLRLIADGLVHSLPDGIDLRTAYDAVPLFPDYAFNTLKNGSWCTAPLFLFLRKVRICRFVLGYLPDKAKNEDRVLFPPWAAPLMESCFEASFARSAEVGGKFAGRGGGGTFFGFPITIANRAVQLRGASGGLGLALGFLSLIQGLVLPTGLAASGAIDESGNVQPVGHLNEKIAFARKKGFKIFLHPDQRKQSAGLDSEMEAIPVSTLGEARVSCELYAPQNGRKLILFLEMLRDPELFANNCDRVSDLMKIGSRKGLTRVPMDRIVSSPELLGVFLQKVIDALQKGALEAADSLAELVPPECRERILAGPETLAVKWCLVNLALSSHRGRVTEAGAWLEAADAKGKAAEMHVEFVNRRLVNRHNLYRFDPYPFDPVLQSVLESQENVFKANADMNCPLHPPLGSLYGTLAQNAAFCGPEYINDFERYASLAGNAFGEIELPFQHREQWLRQYSYRVFAYLDAGMIPEAESALKTFLSFSEWPELRESTGALSLWQHAALARFLSDASHPEAGPYLGRTPALKKKFSATEHPFQLWVFNLARIAVSLGKVPEAQALFTESLNACMCRKNGATVRAMALLPLSWLKRLDRLPSPLEAYRKEILDAAGELDPDHFRMLREVPFDSLLEDVQKHPGKWFPFTYR